MAGAEMTLNLNASVVVTLTDEGKRALESWNAVWNPRGPVVFVGADCIYECQFWELFQVFGAGIRMGVETPFKNNEITIRD